MLGILPLQPLVEMFKLIPFSQTWLGNPLNGGISMGILPGTRASPAPSASVLDGRAP